MKNGLFLVRFRFLAVALVVAVVAACLSNSACAFVMTKRRTRGASIVVMAFGDNHEDESIGIGSPLQQVTSVPSVLSPITSTRRDALANAFALGTTAAIVTLATTVSPQTADAATTAAPATATTTTSTATTTTPVTKQKPPPRPRTTCRDPCFTGVWYDPNHPNGYRTLIQKSDFKATMVLDDGGTDILNPNPQTFRDLPVTVTINKKEGTTDLGFDFGRKAGLPKKVVGRLSKDGREIVFPDGNTWTKNPASAIEGVYATDPRVAGEGYRVVVVRATGVGASTERYAVQLNRKQATTATTVVVVDDKNDKPNNKNKDKLRFVFPGKDPTPVDATFEDGVISFPFPVQSNASGNTWTKWDEWTKL